ncbi:hypothetical protein [Acidocella sp.]|uniref:hypothetical protein n=1 Tax=Acidocella sp. TaxID=50710 RepID=UPI0017A85630|nr:hypothetical protein [Acidocella sp.]NNM55549.1 hypothetical protein [Acidocella sp.]
MSAFFQWPACPFRARQDARRDRRRQLDADQGEISLILVNASFQMGVLPGEISGCGKNHFLSGILE